MAAAVTILKAGISRTRSTTFVPFTVTLSGSYAADGDPLDLSSFDVKTQKPPILVQLNAGAGFGLAYNATDGTIMVYTSPGVELDAGAYPESITGDDAISGIAIFPN